MSKRSINNTKLGAFVLAGLLFLVLLLYMIGKNRNLFGSTYVLKARFSHVQGLVPGNNVRFSGIQAGTVKRVKILTDTVIEVTMVIEKKMLNIIRKNAVVTIGTEGLVGNTVVNIVPSSPPGELAREGDVLLSKRSVNPEEMMQTLSKTNDDVAIIAEELKSAVQRLNNSNALWTLLSDESLPQNMRMAVAKIRAASLRADNMAYNLDGIVTDIKEGKGSLGVILRDTSLAGNLTNAVVKIKEVANKADSLAGEINRMVADIQRDLNSGKGTMHALLKDSLMVMKLNASLDNIQKGTDGFNQNMEALKHNFLFRGYFRKKEKQKNKESAGQSMSN